MEDSHAATVVPPLADKQDDVSGAAAASNTDLKKNKKKNKHKPFDPVLKELPLNISDEEKICLLSQKCHDLMQEKRDSAAKLKQYENAVNSIRSERDQLHGDRNKLILQKDKLETLCRELQKQNKIVQEESLARCRAEDEKRRAISDHFQTSVTSIQNQLNEYQTRNLDLRRENQELADKLDKFIKHHKEREEHVEKLIHARELETKLSEAKLQKTQCLLDQERIKSQQLVVQMKEESKLMQERVDAHVAVESKLKEQIEFYKNKYQAFNKTIAQSNKLFDNAKGEMEKLIKRIKQTEQEVVEWRGKWELSQRKLIEVVAEHTKQTDELMAARKQIDCLSNLCRALRRQLDDRETPAVEVEGGAPAEVELVTNATADGQDALANQFAALQATEQCETISDETPTSATSDGER